MRRYVMWGAALIAAYLVLENYQGFKSDVGATGTSSVNIIHAFQGR